MELKDHLDKARELVYEAITGKCWHTYARYYRKHVMTNEGTFNIAEAEHWPKMYEGNKCCTRCKQLSSSKNGNNPDLANSLDAWRPLWERMDEQLEYAYHCVLSEIALKTGIPTWKLQPIHHLEAALRAIEVDCDRCKATGLIPRHDCEYNFETEMAACPAHCSCNACTCNKGMRTLWEQLEREVSR